MCIHVYVCTKINYFTLLSLPLPQTTNSVDPVAMMKHSMSGISDQQVGMSERHAMIHVLKYQLMFPLCTYMYKTSVGFG